jgi:hypothetical protein
MNMQTRMHSDPVSGWSGVCRASGQHRRGRTPRCLAALAVLWLANMSWAVAAQTNGTAANLSSLSQVDRVQRRNLAEYEGVYSYHGTTRLALVAVDTMLLVVLDGAKYPLRPIRDDRFLNSRGDTILFRRGDHGIVSGFIEGNVFFARHTPVVDACMRFRLTWRTGCASPT